MDRRAERSENTFQGMECKSAAVSSTSESRNDRLAALGQVASGVAHDFNNLLGVIGQFADSMLRKSDRAEQERLAALIRVSVDRGAVLTRKLLSFAGPGASTARTLRLDEALDGLEDLVRYAVPSHLHLEYERAADPWVIHVDPDALQLAMLNLVINSRDAMPERGTLKISMHNVSVLWARSRSLGLAVGEYVEIRVADSGCGMSMETLRQCFVRDFTTKGHNGGSGLGLHQVATFARAVDGAVEALSEEGVGTTVAIYLPRVTSPYP